MRTQASDATHSAPLRPVDPEEYVTGPFLQRRLNVCRATVRRWRKAGLPCVGEEKGRRYKWSDVLAFLGNKP